MFEEIKQSIIREISSSIGAILNSATKQVQRRLLWFIIRATVLIVAIIFCAIGIILLGARYVGADLMFLTVGVLFLILFLVSK